jgi:hypothetical protein
MNGDAELEVWRHEWQAQASVPADLRRRVERHSRFMRIMLAAEVLVTLVIGGGTALSALRSGRTDAVVLALGTWSFIIAAWIFALLSRRGLWSPSAIDTAAFLDLSIRRARAGIAASVFGTVLYFSEIMFCATWIGYHGKLSRELVVFLIALSTAFVGLTLRYRRRKQKELKYLIGLRDQSGDTV